MIIINIRPFRKFVERCIQQRTIDSPRRYTPYSTGSVRSAMPSPSNQSNRYWDPSDRLKAKIRFKRIRQICKRPQIIRQRRRISKNQSILGMRMRRTRVINYGRGRIRTAIVKPEVTRVTRLIDISSPPKKSVPRPFSIN